MLFTCRGCKVVGDVLMGCLRPTQSKTFCLVEAIAVLHCSVSNWKSTVFLKENSRGYTEFNLLL